MKSLVLRLCLALPIASVVIIGAVPLLRLLRNATRDRLPPTWTDMRSALITTSALWACCLVLQLLIALYLGPRFRGRRWSLALAAPALLGPTVAALLWKAILHPGRGIIAQMIAVPGWDTTFTANAVIAFVNIWVWGLAAASFVSCIFGPETAQVRDLYLLDGGRAMLANLWALFVMKRSWLGVLLFALSIENLRTFEIVSVLTGGVNQTATLAFHIYDFGWRIGNTVQEAFWALLLIVLNILCTVLLSGSLRLGRSAWRLK